MEAVVVRLYVTVVELQEHVLLERSSENTLPEFVDGFESYKFQVGSGIMG